MYLIIQDMNPVVSGKYVFPNSWVIKIIFKTNTYLNKLKWFYNDKIK